MLGYRHLFYAIFVAFFLKNTFFYDFWVIYNTEDREYRTVNDKKVPVVHKVLITGASKGIGEQLAYQYARQGAEIVLTARNKAALEQIVGKCKQLGAGSADYVIADMGKEAEVKKVIPFAEQKLKSLDILVLNHIFKLDTASFKGDMQFLRQTMEVNFHSSVKLAWDSRPLLDKSSVDGRILVVSTAGALFQVPFLAPYLSSKRALEGFFGSWRQELALQNSNISITVVPLGLIGTETGTTSIKRIISADKLSMVGAASPEVTANVVMRAGLSRAQHIMYPHSLRVIMLLRDWTAYFDNNLRQIVNTTP